MGFGGVAAFTQLSDTPRTYAGQALKALGVKAGENGLEFAIGLPPLDFGPGFNFLKVSQIGGQPFAEWADIQGLIIALAAASPPGRTALPSVPAPVPAAVAVVVAVAAVGSSSAPDLPVPVPNITSSAVLV